MHHPTGIELQYIVQEKANSEALHEPMFRLVSIEVSCGSARRAEKRVDRLITPTKSSPLRLLVVGHLTYKSVDHSD